jgi:hypothetical protein
MMLANNAEALALAMLEAGRDPLWVVLVVGWYFGNVGRQVALDLAEQRGNNPTPEGVTT